MWSAYGITLRPEATIRGKRAQTVDFLGSSLNYQNSLVGFERSQLGLPYAYCLDLLRSAAGRGRGG